jgi:hypothetical protein
MLFGTLLPIVLMGQENEKKLDACTLLSADDAAKIAGTQMWFVHGAKESCEYIDKKPAILRSTPFSQSVTLGMKRYKSAQIVAKEWAKETAVHDQSKGNDIELFRRKNPQVLSGIGDAAYLFGDVEEGKIGLAAVYVRKGTLILALENFDLHTTSSAEALIAVARKIANQL